MGIFDVPRYCPQRLAGDGSPVQQQYGGPWKKLWHLPIAFACPEHHLFLQDSCPRNHQPGRTISQLITQPADGTLHPAQCRRPHADQSAGRGRKGPSCGARLDQIATESRPSTGMLKTQQPLIDFLGPRHPAAEAASYFTDLRVATALLCSTWPLGRDLLDASTVTTVEAHVRWLGGGIRQGLEKPPKDPIATAALLTAAATVLDASDLETSLLRLIRSAWAGRPSRAPWARVLDRHESSCSARLLQAAEPSTRSFRRTARGTKAPVRSGGYRPEHIPAFLEQDWYQKHLADLQCHSHVKTMRRVGDVLLVQWAAGGSIGDAAGILGINLTGGQYAATSGFYQWLNNDDSARFTHALTAIAGDLDSSVDLTDYQRRREALRCWSLAPDTWSDIVAELPPVPGPVRPNLDDRKRQEASAFVWAHVTRGEAPLCSTAD